MTDDPKWVLLSNFPTVASNENVHPFEMAVLYWPITLILSLLSGFLILYPGKRKVAQPTQNST